MLATHTKKLKSKQQTKNTTKCWHRKVYCTCTKSLVDYQTIIQSSSFSWKTQLWDPKLQFQDRRQCKKAKELHVKASKVGGNEMKWISFEPFSPGFQSPLDVNAYSRGFKRKYLTFTPLTIASSGLDPSHWIWEWLTTPHLSVVGNPKISWRRYFGPQKQP